MRPQVRNSFLGGEVVITVTSDDGHHSTTLVLDNEDAGDLARDIERTIQESILKDAKTASVITEE